MGESITEATVISIRFKAGDSFSVHDTILELETEKTNFEVSADSAGILKKLLVKEGDIIEPGLILGEYEEYS